MIHHAWGKKIWPIIILKSSIPLKPLVFLVDVNIYCDHIICYIIQCAVMFIKLLLIVRLCLITIHFLLFGLEKIVSQLAKDRAFKNFM